MTAIVESAGWRLGLAIWIAGMMGVLPATFIMLPELVANLHRASRIPMWLGSLIATVQTGLFLALFVWAGVALAPKLGLRAPTFEALVSGRSVAQAIRPQLLPGILAGLVLAVIPWYFTSHGLIVELHSPRSLVWALLYGGITEEIMMRWGLMTLLAWAGVRLLRHSSEPISTRIIWAAIVFSAVMFGAGHLPSTHLLVGHLTASAIFAVTGLGAVFGIAAGWLYWRYGLESAILFHASAHVFAYMGYKLTPLRN